MQGGTSIMRSSSMRFFFFLLLAVGLVAFAGNALAQIQINEVRTDNTGADTDEYFELKGAPGTSLNGYTYIVIGDASGTTCGTIESVTPLDGFSIQADGYFAAVKSGDSPVLTGYDAVLTMNFENSDNVTHMLVQGFTGTNGEDLDTNDDGVLDITPWSSVSDCVALIGTGTVDCVSVEYVYCSTQVGPDGTFVTSHAYRCSDTGAWKIGASFSVSPNVDDTPGSANPGCLNPPPSPVGTQRTPCVPFPGNPATVDAFVTSATGANLHYFVNGGPENVLPMSTVGSSGDTTTFEAVIPGQANNGDKVRYYVEAFNGNPDTTLGFDRGYFVGTVDMGPLHASDANGSALYRFYGARVHGNVTVPYGLLQTANTDYYVQDATGALDVFKYGTHTVQPGLGDDITVEGVLDQYNGKLEITTGGGCDSLLVDVNGPGSPPAPKSVTTCDNFESFESELIEFKIATLTTSPDTIRTAGTGTSYPIANCHGDTTVVMYVDTDTGIGGTPATSNVVNVIGIASQFDSSSPYFGGYEIVPRYPSDITFLNATGIGDRQVGPVARLMQNFPNPFGRTTSISYTVPRGAKADAASPVRLTVFDLQGRVVATLVDGLQDAGDHSVNLSAGALAKVGNGIYFYRLEVGDQTFTRKLVFIR